MNKLRINPTQCVLALAVFVAGAAQAQTQATLGNFYMPAYRGQAGTESALWDDRSTLINSAYTNAYGGANMANYIAPGGSALANASVMQTTPGAFIIAGSGPNGGDIYSYSSVNTFVLNYSSSSLTPIGNVIFQAETTGSTLDYSSVLLSYTLASGGQESLSAIPDLLYSSTGDAGGFGESADEVTAWGWNLPLGDDVTSFSIAFNGSDTSVGLERTMLDVSSFNDVVPTPEPSTMALAGIGGIGLLFWQRRFRVQSSR
jgi:hypothetical protein